MDAPTPSRRRAFMFAALLMSVLALLAAVAALYVRGMLPASTSPLAEPFGYQSYVQALTHVQPTGDVDFPGLGRDRAALDAFVTQLAACSPHNRPDLFPTPEDGLAYWLNAYNALVLQQVVDGYPYLESVRQPWLGRFFWGRAWPVGGERLTLWALEHRILHGEYADPRIHFALFNGTRGGPRLDGAHFQPEYLDAQLNDASRRFMADKHHVRLEGDTVHLARVFDTARDDLLAALPEGRRGSVLQFVWAFLPDTCEERPGCDTRGDLDRACGPQLDKCRVVFESEDGTLPDATARVARP